MSIITNTRNPAEIFNRIACHPIAVILKPADLLFLNWLKNLSWIERKKREILHCAKPSFRMTVWWQSLPSG
jgi:hypothetical protein